jgi:large subunit ribosomal protein L18
MTVKLKPQQRRKYRVRNKVRANALKSGFPRLSVHRTDKQIYAQIIDDRAGVTLVSSSTLDKELKVKAGGNKDAASAVGKAIAQKAKKAGVERVVFDRGSFLYHGRIKALADAARDGGLQF